MLNVSFQLIINSLIKMTDNFSSCVEEQIFKMAHGHMPYLTDIDTGPKYRIINKVEQKTSRQYGLEGLKKFIAQKTSDKF